MKSSIQGLVQEIVVNTSFFPLTYIYRKIYELSAAVATLLLRRVDGVVAIYLRRGVAKGEVVYGLSDIDLSVIVKDEDGERESAKERVRATYNRLSCSIPLFGSGEKELGVYSTSEFLNLYNDYGSYKYRFNDGKYTWRLLFGQDVVRSLPRIEDTELYLSATEELKTWWALLNVEITSDSTYPLFKRKYLWYKAIAEASKTYLFVCHGEEVGRREAALTQVKNHLTYEQRCLIDRLESYMKHLTSKEDLILDELMTLFITLVSKTFQEMERRVYRDTEGKKAIVKVPNRHELIAESSLDSLVKELELNIGREVGTYLDSISLIPQVEFNADVLFNSDIDSFYLVLVQRNFIPTDKLRRVRSLFGENLRPRDIEPLIVADHHIAFSLQVDKIHNGIKIKSPRICPLFYALLPKGDLKSMEGSSEGEVAQISCYLPPDTFEEIIKKRVAKINAIISGKDIYKLKTLDFLRFFWGAARTKLLARSLGSDEIRIPLTSWQILAAILRSFPEDSTWLTAMHGEYFKESRGEENEAYRFFSSSVELLKRI